DRARIQDILQEIIEIVAASAGQIWAGLSAFAVKGVAGRARGVEEGSALTRICFCQCCRRELSLPLGNQLLLIRRGVPEFAPNFGELLVQRRVVQTANLTGVKSGNVCAGNSSLAHR